MEEKPKVPMKPSEMKNIFEVNPLDERIDPRLIVHAIIDKKRSNSLLKRLEKHYLYTHQEDRVLVNTKECLPMTFEQILTEAKKSLFIDLRLRKMLREKLYSERIKDELRPQLWMIASGAYLKKDDEPEYFSTIMKELQDYPSKFDETIELDLKRTFPGRENYETDPQICRMRTVLGCFAKRNPHIAYCQGMNFLVAKVTEQIVDVEDAFWIFTTLMEDVMPIDYFSSMLGVLIDQRIFSEMLYYHNKQLGEKFSEFEHDPSLFTLQWFLCCYVCTLDKDTTNLIWDLIMVEGTTVLFRAGLIYLDSLTEQILKMHEFFEIFAIMDNYEKSQEQTSVDDFHKRLSEIYINRKLIPLLRKSYQVIIEEEIELAELEKKKKNVNKEKKTPNPVSCKQSWPICLEVIEHNRGKKRSNSIISLKIAESFALQNWKRTDYFTNDEKTMSYHKRAREIKQFKRNKKKEKAKERISREKSGSILKTEHRDSLIDSTPSKIMEKSDRSDKLEKSEKPKSSLKLSVTPEAAEEEEELPHKDLILGRHSHTCGNHRTRSHAVIRNPCYSPTQASVDIEVAEMKPLHGSFVSKQTSSPDTSEIHDTVSKESLKVNVIKKEESIFARKIRAKNKTAHVESAHFQYDEDEILVRTRPRKTIFNYIVDDELVSSGSNSNSANKSLLFMHEFFKS